jgi:hypothetical protein
MVLVVGLVVFPLAGLTTANGISTEPRLTDRDRKPLHELTTKEDVGAKLTSDVQTEVLKSVGELGGMSSMVQDVADFGNNGDAQQQRRSTSYAVGPLARALTDSDVDVRIEAAQSLGQMDGDSVAIAALSRALREDADARVRKMAAWALGNIEDEAGLPALTYALKNDRDLEVRRTSVWALGQIPRSAMRCAMRMRKCVRSRCGRSARSRTRRRCRR